MTEDWPTELIHISLVDIGDIIRHDGRDRTICKKDIGKVELLGRTIWGDSYWAGNKPVIRVLTPRINSVLSTAS